MMSSSLFIQLSKWSIDLVQDARGPGANTTSPPLKKAIWILPEIRYEGLNHSGFLTYLVLAMSEHGLLN